MEFKQLKGILDEVEASGVKDIELILYHKGEEVFRDKRSQSRPNELGLVNIYSCSKFITCSAALKLYDEGRFSLDDAVSDYIPSFGNIKVKKNGGIYRAENTMKISHLFTMSAGYNYSTTADPIQRCKKDTNGRCPTLKMADYLAEIPLDFEPGEGWNYSLCHDVIPAIVEVISGKRFGEYVKENIFTPLGMDTATFNLPDEKLPMVLPQYKQTGNKEYKELGPENVCYKFGTEYESGGAGCVCTPDDYIKFLEGLRLGKIISLDTIALMSQNMLNESQLAHCTAPKGYGYGLGVRAPLPGSGRTDIGWGGAAGAYASLDISHEMTLYFSIHTIGPYIAGFRHDMPEAAKRDLGYTDAYPYVSFKG